MISDDRNGARLSKRYTGVMNTSELGARVPYKARGACGLVETCMSHNPKVVVVSSSPAKANVL